MSSRHFVKLKLEPDPKSPVWVTTLVNILLVLLTKILATKTRTCIYAAISDLFLVRECCSLKSIFNSSKFWWSIYFVFFWTISPQTTLFSFLINVSYFGIFLALAHTKRKNKIKKTKQPGKKNWKNYCKIKHADILVLLILFRFLTCA